MEIKWISFRDGQKPDPEKVLQNLLQQDRGIVFLDGYSGCGKTACIRQLQAVSPRPVTVFTYRDVTDEMVRTRCNCREYLLEAWDRPGIICVEDVDYLSGKEATQHYLAELVRTAAHKHLLILTGNHLREKTSILCAESEPEIFLMVKE